MTDLAGILSEARERVRACTDGAALKAIEREYLGKQGRVAELLAAIPSLPPEERRDAGRGANELKQGVQLALNERTAELDAAALEAERSGAGFDPTLPAARAARGSLHPITQVMREVEGVFTSMGYTVLDGPEVELDRYNFEALNFPPDHPAREEYDTFWCEPLDPAHPLLLRTHTSPVQIRAMTGRTPPFRFVVPGRVYRNDLDATHAPMFHQIEGFCVGEDVSFADLKGTLYAFARQLFGADTKLRFRAHFFPFTEPSAEMDVSWRGGWLEWGGCGMIHPRVLLNCGVDPERWQGFAFGMGLDRPALLRFGLPSLQLLFDGDLRVLEQR
jgi:phenylalanyl-tRNA synthetase alpha chain